MRTPAHPCLIPFLARLPMWPLRVAASLSKLYGTGATCGGHEMGRLVHGFILPCERVGGACDLIVHVHTQCDDLHFINEFSSSLFRTSRRDDES